jgi:type I protein arginine methyltransferase
MIQDRVRMAAYTRALRTTVRPGATVLDIGTGTGIMALLACRYGAGRVYAVEPSDAIELARAAARANGFENRIVFLQQRSTEVTLERKADVIVSDMRGILPPFQSHLRDIADARDRLLAPAGCLVPRMDTLWGAVVAAPEFWRRHRGPWHTKPEDIDLSSALPVVTNTWRKARFSTRHLLSAAVRWARLDYRTLQDTRVAGQMRFKVRRAAVGHGLALWFDADLARGVIFSNAPGRPRLIYGQEFLPWPRPVRLGLGDRVEARIRADLVGGDYVWTWETVVTPRGARTETARFRQSTFLGAPLSAETLARRASTHRPTLGEGGQATRAALELMAGEKMLSEIAAELHGRYPAHLPTLSDALAFVADLSTKYGA